VQVQQFTFGGGKSCGDAAMVSGFGSMFFSGLPIAFCLVYVLT